MTSTNPFAMDWAPEDFGLRKARHPPGAYRELAGFPDALANTNPTTKPKKNAAPVQKPGPKPKPKQQRKSPAAPAAGPSKPASLGKTKPKAIAKSKRTVKKASQKTPLGPPQPSSPLSSPPPSPERPTSVRRKRKVAQTEFDEADASGDLGKPPPAPRGAKRPRKEKESAPDEPSKEAKAPKAPAGKKPKAKKAESSSPAASKPRKPRATPVQKASSRGSSHSVASSATLVPSESEPIYHKSRSRSSSSLPNQSSDLKPMPKVIHERDWRTDEDGVPGEGFLSSRMVVESLMRTYKAYFKNPADSEDRSFEPENMPVVRLEYPNTGASEEYLLLAPKDVDHYNPIFDLESTLYTIIEYYCTPEQQAEFGSIPQDTLSESDDTSRSTTPRAKSPLTNKKDASDTQPTENETNDNCPPGQPPLPLLQAFKRALEDNDGPAFVKLLGECNVLLRSFKETYASPCSTVSSPLTQPSDDEAEDDIKPTVASDRDATAPTPPIPTISAEEDLNTTSDQPTTPNEPPSTPSRKSPPPPTTPPKTRRLSTASIPFPFTPTKNVVTPTNTLMLAPLAWKQTGLPNKVLMRIVEENYQRTVGPNVPKLRAYRAFSNTVYGELMPTLIDEIVSITNTNESSLFLDLGSGVGNVCVQASLQSGCRTFGVELMKAPARVAVNVEAQARIRARMWGLRMGEVALEESDMLKSAEVDRLLSQADVVLVDNKVFTESLNEALRTKFLDLKEGAVVVSLAPFVSDINARFNPRNLDSMTAIFDVTERQYGSGGVSWGHTGGSYYVHRVDREGYERTRREIDAANMMRRPVRRTKAQKEQDEREDARW